MICKIRNLHSAIALAFAMSSGAQASTIVVTDAGDAGTAATCTLRQALAAANADFAGASSCVAGSGADTVTFAPSLANTTITLAGGGLSVSDSLTLVGSGQTIDGASAAQILSAAFSVASGTPTLTLSDVTLTNGSSATSAGALYAAGVDVTLRRVTISNSTSHGLAGGVAVVGGQLLIDHSTVSGNHSTGTVTAAGGVRASGAVNVTIQSSSITSNVVLMDGSTEAAGGVLIDGDGTAALTMVDSVVASNSVSGMGPTFGGGIVLQGASSHLFNSTLASNSAVGSVVVAGGLLILPNGASPPTTQTTNCTIASNSSVGSGVSTSGGVVAAAGGGSLTFDNTIVARNLGTNPDVYLDPSATATAHASVLGVALQAGFASGGNVFSDNPGVLALSDNGGRTLTMALSASSVAVNLGDASLAVYGAEPLHYDQRGFGYPRQFNGAIDAGAFQHQGDRIFGNGLEDLP